MTTRRLSWQAGQLYNDTRKTGISVVLDASYPGMWRVRWLDGRLSDMVNLARAKDAAEISFQNHARHSGPEAPPIRQTEAAVLG